MATRPQRPALCPRTSGSAELSAISRRRRFSAGDGLVKRAGTLPHPCLKTRDTPSSGHRAIDHGIWSTMGRVNASGQCRARLALCRTPRTRPRTATWSPRSTRSSASRRTRRRPRSRSPSPAALLLPGASTCGGRVSDGSKRQQQPVGSHRHARFAERQWRAPESAERGRPAVRSVEPVRDAGAGRRLGRRIDAGVPVSDAAPYRPSLSPDELTVYFSGRTRSGGLVDFRSTRPGAQRRAPSRDRRSCEGSSCGCGPRNNPSCGGIHRFRRRH
jgi:hypothetical protein